jgi:hypothetical protein
MNKKKLSMMAATVLMAGLVAGMGTMTYAKYITETSTTQQATAAQWGFVVTANTSKLFGDAYENKAVTTNRDAEGVNVKAATAGNYIVAPGTSGSMSISIQGTAEVDAQLQVTADTTTAKDIGITGKYYPIVWTLTEGATSKSGTLTEVLGELVNISTKIEANTSYQGNFTLSWEWPMETTTGEGVTTNNIYDTLIGYKSAGKAWTEISSYIDATYQTTYENNINKGIEFALDIAIVQI